MSLKKILIKQKFPLILILLTFLSLLLLANKSFGSGLQINCKADYDKNGTINIVDFSEFARNYKINNLNCDLDIVNSDCFLNLSDFQAFAIGYNIANACQTTATATTYNLKVLTVNYNPIENNQNAAETYYTNGQTARQVESFAYNQVINSFHKLSNNRINYQVVKQIDINEFPTFSDGTKFDITSYKKCVWGTVGFDPVWCDVQKAKFNYVDWTKKYKICEIAEANNVDEIWVMSLPYVMQWEAFMLGPNVGFGVNGGTYAIDTCHKHYVVIDGAYNTPDNLMHDIGHRVEATMVYLTSIWKSEDTQKYWVNFARWGTGELNTANTCGNTHFPTNATVGYDYSNTRSEISSCPDWKNFPDLKGERLTINCQNWDCKDSGWQTYWLGSLPSSPGEASMVSNTGKQFSFKKDWWYYLLYPDNAISFVKLNSQ